MKRRRHTKECSRQEILSVTHDLLFQRKNVIIEEHMQFFIRVVDAELFQRVGREVFEAKNVQHAKGSRRVVAWCRTAVYMSDEPGESTSVKGARHCVTVLTSLDEKEAFVEGIKVSAFH